MTAFLLKVVGLLRPLYQWQGVDFQQLKAIVGVKLEMDNRRTIAFNQTQTSNPNATMVWMFIIFGIFGIFFSLLLIFLPNLFVSYSIFFSYLITMVIMTLVGDFSAVLLDTSDNTIVLPKPISAKTFYAARSTHIFLYIGMISLALCLVPMVASFFAHGALVGFIVCLLCMLSVFFAVACTQGLYLLLMRFTSEERLKNLINYFQIGITVLVLGGYQILPRVFDFSSLEEGAMAIPGWSVLVPPMWMATAVQWASGIEVSGLVISNLVLAVTMPFLVWMAVTKFLAPYFSRKIADLGTGSAPTAKPKTESQSNGWSWLTKPGTERAAFALVSLAMKRDRKFKLRVYPSLGSFIILAAMFILRNKSKDDIGWADYFNQLGESPMYLFLIYLSSYVILAITTEVNYSDDYKATWIFDSAPIKQRGPILLGMVKAAMVQFFLPVYIFATAIILWIWGVAPIGHLVIGFLVGFMIALCMALIGDKGWPLGLPSTARNQGSGTLRVIVGMVLTLALGFGHYYLIRTGWWFWLAIPVLLIIVFWASKKLESITD